MPTLEPCVERIFSTSAIHAELTLPAGRAADYPDRRGGVSDCGGAPVDPDFTGDSELDRRLLFGE